MTDIPDSVEHGPIGGHHGMPLTPNQVNDAYWAKNRVAHMDIGCPRDRDIPVVSVTFRRRRSDLSYDYELDEEQATLLMVRLGAMLDRIRTGGGKRQTNG